MWSAIENGAGCECVKLWMNVNCSTVLDEGPSLLFSKVKHFSLNLVTESSQQNGPLS